MIDRPRRAFNVRTDTATGSVLAVRNVDAFEFDQVGADIWKMCDGENTPTTIAEAICDKYDVPLPVAESDVREFLEELAKNGLLE